MPVETIKRILDEAEPLAAADTNVAQAVARLRTSLDEVVVLDRVSPVRFAALPATLGYRLYRAEEKPLKDAGPIARVITILVMPDQAAAVDGAMRLVESRDEVSAEIETPCPACGAKQHFTVPVIASLEKILRNDADYVQRMARGDWRCTSCGAPIVVQSTFALDCGVQGGWSMVFPDALGPGAGIIKQQVEVVSELHRAWRGELLDVASVVPWGGILAFGIRAATATGMQRTLDVGTVVFGLLSGQIEEVRAGLDGCLESVNAGELVREEEIAAAILAVVTASGAPVPDRYATEAMTLQVNYLIGKARTMGLEPVMARVEGEFTDIAAKAAEMDAALRTAADGDARRKLLRLYLQEAPDYSSDREQALSNLYLLGAELEMQSLRDRGIDKSAPQEYAQASSRFALARQLADEKIAEDRRLNSAAPGKALLEEALGGNRPFVLLLRAFTIDVPIGRPSEVVKKLTDRFGDARFGWNVFTILADNSGRSIPPGGRLADAARPASDGRQRGGSETAGVRGQALHDRPGMAQLSLPADRRGGGDRACSAAGTSIAVRRSDRRTGSHQPVGPQGRHCHRAGGSFRSPGLRGNSYGGCVPGALREPGLSGCVARLGIRSGAAGAGSRRESEAVDRGGHGEI